MSKQSPPRPDRWSWRCSWTAAERGPRHTEKAAGIIGQALACAAAGTRPRNTSLTAGLSTKVQHAQAVVSGELRASPARNVRS